MAREMEEQARVVGKRDRDPGRIDRDPGNTGDEPASADNEPRSVRYITEDGVIVSSDGRQPDPTKPWGDPDWVRVGDDRPPPWPLDDWTRSRVRRRKYKRVEESLASRKRRSSQRGPAWLLGLNLDRLRTLAELGRMLGMDPRTLRTWLRRFDILPERGIEGGFDVHQISLRELLDIPLFGSGKTATLLREPQRKVANWFRKRRLQQVRTCLPHQGERDIFEGRRRHYRTSLREILRAAADLAKGRDAPQFFDIGLWREIGIEEPLLPDSMAGCKAIHDAASQRADAAMGGHEQLASRLMEVIFQLLECPTRLCADSADCMNDSCPAYLPRSIHLDVQEVRKLRADNELERLEEERDDAKRDLERQREARRDREEEERWRDEEDRYRRRRRR